MYFYVNEFEVGVNDSIFTGNEQQKVYNYMTMLQFSRALGRRLPFHSLSKQLTTDSIISAFLPHQSGYKFACSSRALVPNVE